MQAPAVPVNEAQRLRSLARLGLAGPGHDARCQRYARLARALMDAPIAVVSMVDADDQWFRGCEGLAVEGTPRAVSFCGHALLQAGVMHVPDASLDARFAGNPLVTGEPGIRAYAGCPLVMPGGLALGTLCVIDRVPRHFDAPRLALLRDLADCLQNELSTQVSVADMQDVAANLAHLLPPRD